MSLSDVYPEAPRIERKRARLPHSDSGRLIWPSVSFTSHGAAANAPIATSAMAAPWRIEGLILSAIISPKPRPMAARVMTSNGSTGSCSEVFEMDIGKDIAYHIRRVWEKETAIFATLVISSEARRSREWSGWGSRDMDGKAEG